MKAIKAIEKLQNFRLLPIFVMFSMAVGVGIGKIYGITNFEWTPPIDAIKSIFRGGYSFSLPNTLALATVVGPLIEVPVVLVLVWMARRPRVRLFAAWLSVASRPAD